MSYYSNLGLFWEVMAPVFFEMSDIYDEGGFKGVPDAMNFLVNGIFAIRSSHLPPSIFGANATKSSRNQRLHVAAAAALCEAVFYRTSPFRGTKSYNAQAKQVPDDQKTFTTEFSMLMYSNWFCSWHSAHTNAGYVALPAAISGGLLPATLPGQR